MLSWSSFLPVLGTIFFPHTPSKDQCLSVDKIHMLLTAVHCFDNSYVGKQLVTWKEYCMDRCTGHCEVTEIMFKMALNSMRSINLFAVFKSKPFLKQFHVFTALTNRPSENIVGKDENPGNQHFLLFPQSSLLLTGKPLFSVPHPDMLPAFVINLKVRKLLSCKGFRDLFSISEP